jgi:glyoxylase-like metal-dependent hydrolase (beta-lactamase superfamily II)
MHKMTFYPLGNADCCKIDLSNGGKLLFDYANMRDDEDEADLRINLAKALKDDLQDAKRQDFDVVAFTHADDDHIHGFSEFFYLEHAEKYQAEDRVKIKDLWVPAAIITEEGAEDEARILRTEARHRLKKGKGIRVFSRPDRLKDWLKDNDWS